MSAGKFSHCSDDDQSYRKFFARRWQRFLHENFDNPATVRKVFKVDRTTAENWWNGYNAPQGWAIGKAVRDPDLQESVIRHLNTDESPTCEHFAAE